MKTKKVNKVETMYSKFMNKEFNQSVLVFFNRFPSIESIHQLEDLLQNKLDKEKLGFCDGHEINCDLSDGILFLYGPDAELLYKGIKPILKKISFMKDAKVRLHFGAPEKGVKQIVVDLDDNVFENPFGNN